MMGGMSCTHARTHTSKGRELTEGSETCDVDKMHAPHAAEAAVLPALCDADEHRDEPEHRRERLLAGLPVVAEEPLSPV